MRGRREAHTGRAAVRSVVGILSSSGGGSSVGGPTESSTVKLKLSWYCGQTDAEDPVCLIPNTGFIRLMFHIFMGRSPALSNIWSSIEKVLCLVPRVMCMCV